jgi:hypothetical protein
MLKAMLGCAGADSGRFAATRIGESFEVPALGAPPATPDMAALAACETAGRFDGLR